MLKETEYDSFINKVACYGYDFGNTQSPSGNVQLSPAGAETWSALSSIDLWSDTYVKGGVNGTLSQGYYDVKLTSSSGTDFVLSSSFIVSAGDYLDYGYLPNGWMTKSPVTTNDQYFSERRLFDLWTTEAYNKHGVSMVYYPISFDLNYDKLYGEDLDRKVIRKFDLMCFYTLPREEKLWSRFGIENMDNFSMFCSKKHFQIASTYDYTQTTISYGSYIPKIGDIIKSKFNDMMYEIIDVKEESGQFLQSKQHIWEFLVKSVRKQHLGLSATTSASLSGDGLLNTVPDIFDLKNDVIQKVSAINYVPDACQAADINQFWS